MKIKFETTGSTKMKKIKKKTANDDYGLKLPTDDIRKEDYDSDEEDLRI